MFSSQTLRQQNFKKINARMHKRIAWCKIKINSMMCHAWSSPFWICALKFNRYKIHRFHRTFAKLRFDRRRLWLKKKIFGGMYCNFESTIRSRFHAEPIAVLRGCNSAFYNNWSFWLFNFSWFPTPELADISCNSLCNLDVKTSLTICSSRSD